MSFRIRSDAKILNSNRINRELLSVKCMWQRTEYNTIHWFFSTANSQLPAIRSACLLCKSMSIRTGVVTVTFWRKFLIGGHMLNKINSLLGGDRNSICSPHPLTGRVCLAKGVRPALLRLTCFLCKKQQREHEGNWGLCYWLHDIYELCLLIIFFSFPSLPN